MAQLFWIGGTLKMKCTKFHSMPKLTVELMTIAQIGVKVERFSNHSWFLVNKLLVTSLLLNGFGDPLILSNVWPSILLLQPWVEIAQSLQNTTIALSFNPLQYLIIHHLTMELSLQVRSSFLPPWCYLQTACTRVLSLAHIANVSFCRYLLFWQKIFHGVYFFGVASKSSPHGCASISWCKYS